jgi:hypothetical protein
LITQLNLNQIQTFLTSGTYAQLCALQGGSTPLQLGQMYFATDTGNLYFGTPGVGIGYIQIGDTRAVNETLLQLLSELRCIRLAITQLACEGGRAKAQDFDPQTMTSDTEMADAQQI